jgi:hypothetical protein
MFTTLQSRIDSQPSGPNAMNRIQSVEKRNCQLARLWHQYSGMRVVLSVKMFCEKTCSQVWIGGKSLRGNRFYKSHRDIAKKASVPLKMYLKRLAILGKTSIFLKQFSKIIEIFIKAPHFLIKATISLGMSQQDLSSL